MVFYGKIKKKQFIKAYRIILNYEQLRYELTAREENVVFKTDVLKVKKKLHIYHMSAQRLMEARIPRQWQ